MTTEYENWQIHHHNIVDEEPKTSSSRLPRYIAAGVGLEDVYPTIYKH